MKLWKRFIAVYAIANMTLLAVSAPAGAALVTTDQVAAEARGARAERARVEAALARREVQAGLLRHGVTPQEVKARVDALTDDEARLVAQQLDRCPRAVTAASSARWC